MIRTKLLTHHHPLYPSPWVRDCDGCRRKGGYIKDGYRCYECEVILHKECAESLFEIKSLSHEHPLYLSFLEKKSWFSLKRCKFDIDPACAKCPPPNHIEYLKSHKHSLVLTNRLGKCYMCEDDSRHRFLYGCYECRLEFHIECLTMPLEINYPYHSKHPLKFIWHSEHHYSDGKCRICGEELGRRLYHCSICKFSIDFGCAKDPPPFAVLCTKTHEHQLNLLPRQLSFTCDVCGMSGDRSPYSCQECDFMIHQDCMDLPQIIKINRHDHRILKRFYLSPGRWECDVCYQKVDWSYGAYSCSRCPNYAVHSKCAIRGDIWDKLELEGIPEETDEIDWFMEGDLLHHFTHEKHNFKLNEENVIYSENIRCEACAFPIKSHLSYGCTECDFILHKTCVSLPKKKRHVYHDKPLTLLYGEKDVCKLFRCSACSNYSNGFRYINNGGIYLDAKCVSLSGSITHESHPCPLYYFNKWGKCDGCDDSMFSSFCCVGCNFSLDFKCVTLPITTRHWHDEHSLRLNYVKKKSEDYDWCEICEEKIDITTWFYTCDDCCIAMHTKCVLGDFSRLIPGRVINKDDLRFEVMQTSPAFLPRCYICHLRRTVPFVLKFISPKENIFICSLNCYTTYYLR